MQWPISMRVCGSRSRNCIAHLTLFVAAAISHQRSAAWIDSAEETVKESHVIGRVQGSSKWLLQSETYRSWVDSKDKALLWIQAAPGMGKSTLCSVIVDDLVRRRGQHRTILFCFISECIGQMEASQCLLRTLLYQVLRVENSIAPRELLRSLLWSAEELNDPISLERFRHILGTLLGAIKLNASVTFVIDGLDEDREIKAVLEDEIDRVNTIRGRKRAEGLKCVISSQELYRKPIVETLGMTVDLSDECGMQTDMFRYANNLLSDVPWAFSYGGHSRTAVAKWLCDRAQGNFLWLSLVIEDLYRMETDEDIIDKVKALPATVEGIYEKRLTAITRQDVPRVQVVFSWLTVARRLISLSELMHAMKVTLDSIQEFPTHDEFNRLCGWLVTTTSEGIVRFRHPSVGKYLISAKRMRWSRHPVIEAHELLAQACLKILASDEKENIKWINHDSCLPSSKLKSATSLRQYAAAYWSLHYRSAEAYSRVLAGTLQRSLEITLEYFCQAFPSYECEGATQITSTTLRVCAQHGFLGLTKLCLEKGTNPDGDSCDYCPTPLAIAAAGGHTDVAALLLKRGASARSIRKPTKVEILHIAAAHGSLQLAELLLVYGAKPDAMEYDSGRTALHIAAECGHLELVRSLVGQGIDLNSALVHTLETPLHLAARRGHLEVVRCLIDGRAASAEEVQMCEIIVKQPYYQTWIQESIIERKSESESAWRTMKHLAEKDMTDLISNSTWYANVHRKTCDGWTPLHLAASNGHADTVQLLIERGASIQDETYAQRTALHLAIENCHLNVVKGLLEVGATEKMGGKLSANIINDIEKRGHVAIARLLWWQAFCVETTQAACPPSLFSLATRDSESSLCDHGSISRFQKTPTTTYFNSKILAWNRHHDDNSGGPLKRRRNA